jgi:hypothetical protein
VGQKQSDGNGGRMRYHLNGCGSLCSRRFRHGCAQPGSGMIFQSAVDIDYIRRRFDAFNLFICFAAGFLFTREYDNLGRSEVRHLDGIDHHRFVAHGGDDA